MRWREWKAVTDQSSDWWELFNIESDRTESDRTESDRTETTDLSSDEPLILEGLAARWQEWADSHNVYPKWE